MNGTDQLTRPTTPAGRTSLDPVETNVPASKPTHPDFGDEELTDATAFRHSGWANHRAKVYAALRANMESPTRIMNFASCGDTAWIARSKRDPSKYTLLANTCKDRFCVPCCGTRARKLAARVQAKMSGTRYRFLTLTLRHNDAPLPDQIDRLLECFKTLRKTQLWKTCVRGGVSFAEIKVSDRTHRWHPHLHVLIHGRYVDQKLLRHQWERITTDSRVIYIEQVKDKQEAASYCAKYCTKGWDSSIFVDDAKLLEAVAALKGRRLTTTFGDWRGFRLNDDDNDEEWEQVAPLKTYLDGARDGDPHCIWVLRSIRHLPVEGPHPPERAPPPDKPRTDTPGPVMSHRAQQVLADWLQPRPRF